MLDALSAGLLGFLLGLKHATDSDHVIAVSAIVARERTFARAAWIGGLWGIGHSLTVFVVGGSIVAFRLVIPARLGLGLEFGVALMLILLGFNNLRPQAASKDHGHEHAPSFNGLRPVLVGIVHGLAGSAAVAILVLAAIPQTALALAYLAVFGVGTIAGMTLVTGMIAAPAIYAGHRMARFQTGIRLAAGTLSVVFGVLLAREIIVNGGLFSAAPSWSPR
jgi:hypothetical protein